MRNFPKVQIHLGADPCCAIRLVNVARISSKESWKNLMMMIETLTHRALFHRIPPPPPKSTWTYKPRPWLAHNIPSFRWMAAMLNAKVANKRQSLPTAYQRKLRTAWEKRIKNKLKTLAANLRSLRTRLFWKWYVHKLQKLLNHHLARIIHFSSETWSPQRTNTPHRQICVRSTCEGSGDHRPSAA